MWLAERRSGLGATDAAAIVGASKWATPYDVYLEKKGHAPPKEDTSAMWFGRELEDIIARRYAEVTGRRLWNPARSFAHPDFACVRASPDRIVIGEERGLEVKTASQFAADEWGPEGTDVIPDAYLVQVAVNMAVMRYSVWDVALLMGAAEFRIYTVRREDDFEAWVLDKCVTWWRRYVEGDEVPDITGAASTADLLARRFPRDAGVFIDADPKAAEWRDAYLAARGMRTAFEAQEEEAKNNLKAYMGEASGVTFGDGSRVTWKASKEVESVDWRAAASELRVRAEAAGIDCGDVIEAATARRPGARRFLFSPAKKQAE